MARDREPGWRREEKEWRRCAASPPRLADLRPQCHVWSQLGRRKDAASRSSSWFHWLEAMLPLGIIGGFLYIMGNAQYYIHRAVHGRPKHIGNDMWNVAMERRDKKLVDQPSSN